MEHNRLKEYREKAGLSQTELAWRAKIAAQNISAIERGTLSPWPKVIKALVKVLKVTEGELFPREIDHGKDSN